MARQISRREFIKDAAVAGAAVAGTGVLNAALTASPAQAAGVPDKWDKEADVVVIGYGGSGAVTAITATDAGAKVLVLEKAPVEGGGGTRGSSCNVVWTDKPEDAAAYMYAVSWGATPKEDCLSWAQNMTKSKDWFNQNGIPISVPTPGAEFPKLAGAAAIQTFVVTGNGPAYWKAIDAIVKKKAIDVLFDTPAQELVQNPATGEIVGVIAQSKGQKISVRAKRGVVIASGGFEFNETMKLNYLKAMPYHFYNWKYNTGDGIRMAQKVGADLWHMNGMATRLSMWFPEFEIAFSFQVPSGFNFIFVDKRGRRYGNEMAGWRGHHWGHTLTDLDLNVPEFTRIPSYCIFDEKTRLAGPFGRSGIGILSYPAALGGATWSKDNSEEIAKGWIKKADTINALAAQIQMDPAVLNDQVNVYNQACADKKDAAFGRNAESLQPIANPPYYAVALWPSGCNTNGGPRRNTKGQILDSFGNPIPRLYGAGTCGLSQGFFYIGASAFAETIFSGQAAGKNASAEKPLT